MNYELDSGKRSTSHSNSNPVGILEDLGLPPLPTGHQFQQVGDVLRESQMEGFATLRFLIEAFGLADELPGNSPSELASLLQEPLPGLLAFLSAKNAEWWYNYGGEYEFEGKTMVRCHRARHLYLALQCVRFRFTPAEQSRFMKRLAADRQYHAAALLEFACVHRLSPSTKLSNSVPIAKGDVDWLIETEGNPKLYVEVKQRTKDLVLQVTSGKDWDDGPPLSQDDPDLYFRSVAEKFPQGPPTSSIHAVWLNMSLKTARHEFRQAFDAFVRQNPDRIHCAVLGDWTSRAWVVAINDVVKLQVMEVLELQESDHLTFGRSTG